MYNSLLCSVQTQQHGGLPLWELHLSVHFAPIANAKFATKPVQVHSLEFKSPLDVCFFPDHRFNVKVMLLASPPPEELLEKTCRMAGASKTPRQPC